MNDGTVTLPAKEEEQQSVEVDVWVQGTFIPEEAALELPDVLLEEFGASFSRKADNIWGSNCLKAWEMACDRVSAEMETEEGDEVKEDEKVEVDVVEGADSPIVDRAGPCRSNEAEKLFIALRGMFEEETDRKTKKTSWSRREWRRTDRKKWKRQRKAKKMADRT